MGRRLDPRWAQRQALRSYVRTGHTFMHIHNGGVDPRKRRTKAFRMVEVDIWIPAPKPEIKKYMMVNGRMRRDPATLPKHRRRKVA